MGGTGLIKAFKSKGGLFSNLVFGRSQRIGHPNPRIKVSVFEKSETQGEGSGRRHKE